MIAVIKREVQRPLPGIESPDALHEFWAARRQARRNWPRKPARTAAEKRLLKARRDPRQLSIFGMGHTDELTGW